MRFIDRALLGQSLPFAVAVALSFAARLQTIASSLYSGDAYSYIRGAEFDYDALLRQGRFGQALLVWLRDQTGYVGHEVASSALVLSVLLLAHSGLLFAHVILRKPTAAEALIFLVVFTLHPFITEFFYFSEVTLNIVLPLWVASVAMYACSAVRKPLLALALGVFGLSLAIAMYQTVITVVVSVAVIALVARLTSLEASSGEPWLRSRQVRVIVAAMASVPLYLLATRVVAAINTASDARTQFSSLIANPLAKLVTMVEATNLALWPAPGLVPHLDSEVLTFLLVLSAGAVLWSVLRTGQWTIAAACLLLLGVGLTWSAGASALTDVVWLVPRVLVGICAFAAGLLVLGWRARDGKVWRGVLAGGLVILVVGYLGGSNRILYDQRQINRWDMAQANRILMRLELDPHYADLNALAIVGGLWSYPSSLPTTGGDMNASALAVPWAKLGLFEQATGYRFAPASESQMAAAAAYCGSVEPWPVAGSIVVRQELGIICLPVVK